MIRDKVINDITDQVEQLLEAYWGSIDDAYTQTPGPLRFPLTVKLLPGKTDKETEVRVKFKLVCKSVQDETSHIVDERQMKLGEEK